MTATEDLPVRQPTKALSPIQTRIQSPSPSTAPAPVRPQPAIPVPSTASAGTPPASRAPGQRYSAYAAQHLPGGIPGKDVLSPVSFYAACTPDAPALITAQGALSYRQLDHLIRLEAPGLRALAEARQTQKPGSLPPVILLSAGVAPGVLLLIWLAFHAGVAVCPVNPRLPPARLEEIVSRIRPAAVLIQDGGDPKADQVRRRICAGMADLTPLVDRLRQEILTPETDEARDPDAPARAPLLLETSRTADLILTSGSSGTPKAAAHSLSCLLAAVADGDMPESTDISLQSLPLFHIGGLMISLRALASGSAVLVPPPGMAAQEAILAFRPSVVSLVPTQIRSLLDTGADLAQAGIRKLLIGGGAVTRTLLRECLSRGLAPWISYGMTESSAQMCARQITSPEDLASLTASPLPGREIRIREGEIQFRGQIMFRGYLQPDGRLDLPLTADGWFPTGDLGSYEDGQLRVLGRKDCMFVSGGENIHPETVERAISEITGSPRCAVVGVPDPRWGTAGVAVVDGPANGLREKLKACLAPHEVPRHFLPWPEGGSSGGLKFSRKELAAYAARILGSQHQDD